VKSTNCKFLIVKLSSFAILIPLGSKYYFKILFLDNFTLYSYLEEEYNFPLLLAILLLAILLLYMLQFSDLLRGSQKDRSVYFFGGDFACFNKGLSSSIFSSYLRIFQQSLEILTNLSASILFASSQ
jgi:hypothetical protein